MAPESLEPVARAASADQGMEFVEHVGGGAFKETYLVRRSDGRLGALKVYGQHTSVERAEREVQAIVRCSHTNIGSIDTLGHVDVMGISYLYSVEDYLAGGSLQLRLDDAGGQLEPDEVRRVGAALVDALGHIAANRLVHRDLKPDNIMFAEDGRPVIVDFGIVRDLGAHSITHTWQLRGPGTPYYASPEQLNNEKELIDWRADQFSLGVVLTICLLGQHPYHADGDQMEQVVDRVASRQPVPTHFAEAATARGFSSLVRMTQPWPISRYRIPTDLAAAWAGEA